MQLLQKLSDLDSNYYEGSDRDFRAQSLSRNYHYLALMAVLNVTRKVVVEGGGVVAVRALKGLHAAMMDHVRLKVGLSIGAIVAQRTSEATRIR